jgi:hypothetical protein
MVILTLLIGPIGSLASLLACAATLYPEKIRTILISMKTALDF